MEDVTQKYCLKKQFTKIAAVTAVLVLYAVSANAQNAPVGFYLGAILGYGGGELTSKEAAEIDHEPSGGTLGLGAGWSGSNNSWVYGLDADISFTNIEGDDTITVQGFTSAVSHEVNYIGTIRARLGYMAGDAVIYATGGFAAADIDTEMVVTTGGQPVGSDKQGLSATGWTAGLGVDYPVSANLALGAEYLYIDLQEEEVTHTIGGFPFTDEGDFNLHNFRVSLKYFF